MKRRFYLTGGWGYGNRGDNAILMAMLATLEHDFPGFECFLTSHSRAEVKRMHNKEAEWSLHQLLAWHGFWYYPRRLALAFWRWSREHLGRGIMLAPSLRRHLNAMRRADAVIMGGGYFNDAWDDALPSRLLEIEFAKAVGTPLVMYGQTIGPFNEKNGRTMLKEALNEVAFVCHRDVQSETVLRRAQYPLHTSILTADEANLLPVIGGAAEHARFTQRRGQRLVGIMLQNLRPHETPTGPSPQGEIRQSEQYYERACEALKTIAMRHDVAYVVIPSTSWDHNSCRELTQRLCVSGVKNIQMLDDPDVDTFIRTCQAVDVMISTNMHPVIIAATATVPSIALSYHYKLDDYMQSIGMGENCAHIDDFEEAWIVARFEALLTDEHAIRNKLKMLHARVKDLARRNSSALRRIVIPVESPLSNADNVEHAESIATWRAIAARTRTRA
jgi:polysaccharide pyruvyl transferase WcaK-like protein